MKTKTFTNIWQLLAELSLEDHNQIKSKKDYFKYCYSWQALDTEYLISIADVTKTINIYPEGEILSKMHMSDMRNAFRLPIVQKLVKLKEFW